MAGPPPEILRRAIGRHVPLLVLSPHLDDAVLSCGALLAYAAERGTPVTVLTPFTRAGPPPYTLSARRFLRLAGARDAEELYAERRAEDRAVLARIGVGCRHLGLPEGLFRRRPVRDTRLPQPMGRWLERLLPELAHVYPTYRLHLVSGRISPHDRVVLAALSAALAEPAGTGPVDPGPADPGPRLLLAPLAVGRHADHLLVRAAAERQHSAVVYYSDFPYNLSGAADPAFLARHDLTGSLWRHGLDAKAELIRGYRTQIGQLFPGGRIPLVPEIYLEPQKRGTPSRLPGAAP